MFNIKKYQSVGVFLLLLLSWWIKGAAPPPPSNDNCSNATVLTVNANPLCGQTTAGATTQGGENLTSCGNSGINQTVWYSFTATQSVMDVWVDNLVSGGCHLGSIVYNTSTCLPIAANVISCKPNSGQTDFWHHLSGLTAGNTYLVQVLYSSGGPCGGGQTFCISAVAPPTSAGFIHPTSGMGGEYIGACMTNTCSGQFYDDGGPLGNYSNNVNLIYRTFCPNQTGMCIRATVNYIDLESPFDYFYVIDGATQNDPMLPPCNPCSKVGNGTIFTATSANGCLGFRFRSDGSITYAGWNITLSCVPCSANTSGNTNTDCANSTAICSNASFSGSSIGPGITSDGCAGCNTSEHYTNWYYFCAQTSGVLTFTIKPSPTSQDYDFALYGPGVSCNSLGVPIRCSYAAGNGFTGLGNSATDVSEDVSGDGWVAPLNVTAGQCYYLMVNKWDAGGAGFSVDFTGSTASLNCSVLPIELINFIGLLTKNKVILQWSTASEKNNAYFTIEKSLDGINYKEIGKVSGAGTSYSRKDYEFVDEQLIEGIIYYRLSQIDFDGKTKQLGVVTIHNQNQLKDIVIKPNPINEKVYIDIPSYYEDNVIISLKDISGKVIDIRILSLNAGDNYFEIDADRLEKGVYFIEVSNRYYREVFKVFKD